MVEGNISQELGLKSIDETRNCLIEETRDNEQSLAISKLNTIEVLISKALIESVISPDELVLINNILKEYNKMKEHKQKNEKL